MKSSDSAAALSAERQHTSGLDYYFEIKDVALSAHSVFMEPFKILFLFAVSYRTNTHEQQLGLK